MSKLLKSKFLLGVMIVAVIAVVGVVSNGTQAAADDCSTGTTTLRVGSRGAAVSCLQATLDAGIAADGVFGPKTQARVMGWQADNGLVADGVFGAKSRAVLVAGTVVHPGSFPAGCSSAAGFSSTTGLPCTTVVAGLPAGCTTTAGFSPTTGAACSSTVVVPGLPAGCSTTAGFSPTTGAKCDSTTVVSSTGEGSLAVTFDPIPANNLAVNRGDSKDVMAIRLKATGSDMKVSRVWLDINTRIWLSAEKVTLSDGSTVLAELPLSSTTVTELVAGSSYQLQFNGLNVTVPVGTTKVLTFKVTRPTLTTADADVTVAATSSVRAVDMAGITNTYVFPSARAWDMAAVAATTGTMTTALNTSSPAAQSISGLSTTAGVLTPVKLADFNFKGEDSAINITQIVATLAATTGTVADEVASVELRDGSTVLSSVALSTATATFPTLNINVAADTTKVLSVWAQMNPIGTPGAGYTSKGAGITATLDSSATVATDAGFATVTISSADPVGNTQYMFQYAPTLALGATSATQVEGSAVGKKAANFSLAYSVTAPTNSDIYVNAVGSLCGGTYPATKIAAVCTDTTIGGTMITSVVASGTSSKGTGTLATWDKVAAGTTRTFTVTGYTPDGNAAGFTYMSLATNGIQWTNTDNITIVGADSIEQTWGVSDFRTAAVSVTA